MIGTQQEQLNSLGDRLTQEMRQSSLANGQAPDTGPVAPLAPVAPVALERENDDGLQLYKSNGAFVVVDEDRAGSRIQSISIAKAKTIASVFAVNGVPLTKTEVANKRRAAADEIKTNIAAEMGRGLYDPVTEGVQFKRRVSKNGDEHVYGHTVKRHAQTADEKAIAEVLDMTVEQVRNLIKAKQARQRAKAIEMQATSTLQAETSTAV